MNEQKQQMSVEEVLQLTINNLKGIQVPVELSESIGVPILRNINNIQLCLNAFHEQREQKAQEEQEEPEDE